MVLALIPLAGHAQSFTMSNNDINTCGGTFFDPGGASGNYGNNLNLSTTICSDGSGGTHVRLDFSGATLGAGDQLCFYDGTDAAAPQLSCSDAYPPGPFTVQATAVNPSGCLTVVLVTDGADVGAGWSAVMSCTASCQQVLADLVSTIPAAVPADTGWINICPGRRVNFSGIGVYPQNDFVYNQSDQTTTFEWSFGDGGIAYGPEVSHVFQEEGGYFVQLFLTDAQGCRSTNLINQRIRVAPDPDFRLPISYDNTICAGDTVQLNADINSASGSNLLVVSNIAGFAQGGSRSDSLALPDGTGIPYSTSIFFSEFSPGQVLTSSADLQNICVNMEHSYLRDMEISITCPNGTEVVLHNFGGQTGGGVYLGEPNDNDGFNPTPGQGYDYCWASNAPNPTWLQYINTFPVSTLPSGTYSAFGNMDDLLGCPLNGEWTITVTDLWPADNGFIFSWGLEFASYLYPQLEQFQPQILSWQWNPQSSIYYATPDSIAASPQNAGSVSYVFAVTDDFGCVWDTTLRVNVLPFTHPDCFSCQNEFFALRDSAVCTGGSVQLNGAAVAGPNQVVRFETAPDYRFGAANHPHSNPYISPISVSSLGFNTLTNPAVQIESVCIDVETDFASDLNILLRSPNNQQLILSTGNGGSGDNYTITCFSPTATVPIIGQAAPFNGTYQPEGNWSVLNGAQINGDWRLIVSDGFGTNQFGRVKSWSIAFNIPNQVTYTWTPATGLSCTNCPNPVATPAATTTYRLLATDNFNCTHRDTATVTIASFFQAPAGLQTTAISNGNMTWQWTPIPGVTNYEVNINNTGWVTVNTNSYTVTGLATGATVNIEVRAVGGSPNCPPQIATAVANYISCTLAATVAATFPVACPGGMNGAVDVTVSGQQGSLSFFTNFGPNTPYINGNLTGYPAGNYLVWAVDASGCRDTVSFTITQPDTFVVNITPVNIACNGASTGSVAINSTGGTGATTYQWARCTGGSVGSGPLVVNLPASTYCVTISDQIGCSTTRSITLTENTPFSFSTSQDSVQCFGTATGSATIMPSGATSPYTFQWANNPSTTNTATGLTAGFKAVTVTDALGCQAVSGVFVNQPAALVIDSISSFDPACANSTNGGATVFTRGGNGGNAFTWANTNQTTASVINLGGGTYTVTVQDREGCTAVSQTTLATPDPVLLTFTQVNDQRCANTCDGSATLLPSGGTAPYSINWGAGIVPLNVLTFNNLCTGEYQITLTDQRGCTDSERIEIDETIPLGVKFVSSAPDCPGDTNGQITASGEGGTGPYTYLWNTTGTTDVVVGLDCGTYTVTVTDMNGCTVSSTNTLNCPPPIQVTNINGVATRCFGESNGGTSVIAIGGVGGLTYRWSDTNQQSVPNAANLPAGTYTVTITDTNGCSTTASATVTQPVLLTAFATPTAASCVGTATGSIIATPTGGNLLYSYAWSGSADTDNQVNNLAAGTYSVVVTDQNGCTTTVQNITVGQPATPVSLVLTQVQASCFEGNTGIGSASASGSNGAPYSYLWSQGATAQQTNNLAPGTYTVTATDTRGCSATQTISIAELDSISINAILVPPTCFGLTNGIASINDISGGDGNGVLANYTLQWSLPGSPTGVAATGIPGDLPFNVVVTDQQGCNNLFAYTLTQPPPVVPVLAPVNVRCFGQTDGEVRVTSVQGQFPIVDYLWSNSGTQDQIQNLAVGTYTVTVTDSQGCKGSATAAITQPTALQNTFSTIQLKCNGDSNASVTAVPAGGTLPYVFGWSSAGASGTTLTNLSAGTYVLTITDANSCTLIDSQTIAQPALLGLDLTTEDVLCFDTYTGRASVVVSGGKAPYRYALNDADFGGTPTFIGLQAGDYTLRVRDANGCVQSQPFEISESAPIEVTVTPQDVTVTFGEALALGATVQHAVGAVQYQWAPQLLDSFECIDIANCLAITLTPTISNTFIVVATDANGCRGEARVRYTVDIPRGVYVPTGFTPNTDTNNDLLQVFGKGRQVEAIRYFRVFDRWGEVVYEDKNFDVNDSARGWDGTFRGAECMAGVYVWTLEVAYLDGYVEQLHGQTTLIR
jgi:gliding motility-associated-like protein